MNRSMKLTSVALAVTLLSPPMVVFQPAQPAALIRDIASVSFTLVVKADGTLVGWGSDADGQAARPGSAGGAVTAPVTLDLPGRALQVAIGETTAYALLEDGTVWLWGTATSGVMGDGNEPAAPDLPGGRILLPRQLKSLTNVKALSLGYGHAAALLRDGSLWMWGFASIGGQGISGKNLRVPTLLELP